MLQHRTRPRLPLLLAGLLAPCALAAPTDYASAPAASAVPTLEEVLSRLSEAQATIETLQADFEEKKDLTLMKDSVILTGTFYHSRPQNFLWDYHTPSPKKILLTAEVLLAYYPELNKAEEVNVRRWNRRIRRYLQLGDDVEALQQDYDISLAPPEENDLAGTDLLILKPAARRKKSRLEELRIWLDGETGYTRKLAYLEKDGDRSTFTFRNLKVNAGIPDSLYQIDLPGDVRMGNTFTGFSGG